VLAHPCSGPPYARLLRIPLREGVKRGMGLRWRSPAPGSAGGWASAPAKRLFGGRDSGERTPAPAVPGPRRGGWRRGVDRSGAGSGRRNIQRSSRMYQGTEDWPLMAQAYPTMSSFAFRPVGGEGTSRSDRRSRPVLDGGPAGRADAESIWPCRQRPHQQRKRTGRPGLMSRSSHAWGGVKDVRVRCRCATSASRVTSETKLPILRSVSFHARCRGFEPHLPLSPGSERVPAAARRSRRKLAWALAAPFPSTHCGDSGA